MRVAGMLLVSSQSSTFSRRRECESRDAYRAQAPSRVGGGGAVATFISMELAGWPTACWRMELNTTEAHALEVLSADPERTEQLNALAARSELHVSKVRSLNGYNSNQERGNSGRMTTRALKSAQSEQKMDHRCHGQRLREKHVKQMEAMRRIKQALQESNRQKAEQAKTEKLGFNVSRKEADERVMLLNRRRAEAAHALQQRLDAEEENTTAIVQAQSAQMTSQMQRAVASAREHELAYKKREAAMVRGAVQTGTAASQRRFSRERALRIKSRRVAAERDRQRRQEGEEEYLNHAWEINNAAAVQKCKTQQNALKLRISRKEQANCMRQLRCEMEAQVDEAGAWGEAVRQGITRQRHDERFGTVPDANEYSESTLGHTVHGWGQWAKGAMEGLNSSRRHEKETYTKYGASFTPMRRRTR